MASEDAVAYELVGDANSAEFPHPETGERVELLPGDLVYVAPARAAALDALGFLKPAGAPDPEPAGPGPAATAAAEALAEAEDVDLSDVEGSGEEGRILVADVEAAAEDGD